VDKVISVLGSAALSDYGCDPAARLLRGYRKSQRGGVMKVMLNQRHRAGLEFLGAIQEFAGKVLQPAAAQLYSAQVPLPPVELSERKASVHECLGNVACWQFDRLLTRWVAEEVYVRALPAIESVRPAVEAWLQVTEPSGSLMLDPSLRPPAYWEHGFHLTPGGWDGHDLMGPAISELVFNYVLTVGGVGAVQTGEKLNDQRTQVALEAVAHAPQRIVEFGAGSGRFTFALRQAFPNARITALELSVSSLRHGFAWAAEKGADIDWRQANVEHSGLDSASADLVAFYTLMHEVPAVNNLAILTEAFRILAPGGWVLIGEIAPYEKQSAFRSVVLDWETENRGEPYWREAMAMDIPGALADLGFEEIRAYGLSAGLYPWVTMARKPA
jgi:SAM-dependent methyltransferase